MPPADASCTENTLLGGRLRLLQPERGYRVAIDPVLLAAAVPACAGEEVLDAGAGTGAAALCLAARCAGVRVTGVEREPKLLELARRNVVVNGLDGRVALVEGELATALRGASFDRAMTNPPFHAAAAATPPATVTGRAAHLATMSIAAWVQACLVRLRPGGELTLIHRADHLDELLAAFSGRAGAIRIFPLWPKAGAAAKRVIVAARKGSRTPATLLPGLVLHEADGRFTSAADDLLRHGAALPLHA